ncbi:HAD hydrolase-like protein [Tetragenococcus muriaticus]
MVTGKGRRVLEMSLDKLGLGNYFDAMITDDDVINHKPDSERLLKALKILNSNPEEAVFLETVIQILVLVKTLV